MKIILTLMLTLSITLQSVSQLKEWKVVNLSINNDKANSAASYYGDDKIVYSSLSNGRLHLFVGEISNNDVKGKTPFIAPETHEISAAFSDNNKTVYFTRSVYGKENTVKYNKDEQARIAIFKATKTGSSWGNIVPMPFNSHKYDVGHPALSPDKKKLYFSSNMPGTLGKSDIFVVDILGDNKYSEPRNLGKKINSKKNELYPFVDVNNRLSFSSNGHSSKGGLDVFIISLNSSAEDLFHFDTPINSKYDDFSYVYNYNTKRGFLTSNRPGGKGSDDIYIFFEQDIVDDEVVTEENCNQKLTGSVYLNATQNIIPFTSVLLRNNAGTKIGSITTSENGKFSFNVKCGLKYKVEVSKEGYKTSEKIMSTNGQNNVIATKNIFLTTKREPEAAKDPNDYIGKVNFEYNQTDLEERYTYELDKAIKLMKKEKDITIHFESHTDSRAETDFNMQLSEERIVVLKEYLGFKGIYRGRITGDAFGESKPLNRCTKEIECTETEYLVNRRTVFRLTEHK